jgi:hypothetical protein
VGEFKHLRPSGDCNVYILFVKVYSLLILIKFRLSYLLYL